MTHKNNNNVQPLEEITLIGQTYRFIRWAKAWYRLYLPAVAVAVWFLALALPDPDNNKFGNIITNLAPEMLGLFITLIFIEAINELDNERDDRVIRKLRRKVNDMDVYLKTTLTALKDENENQRELLTDVTSELRAIKQELVGLSADEETILS